MIDERTYISIIPSFMTHEGSAFYHVSIPTTSNVQITHKRGIVNQVYMSLKTSFVRYISYIVRHRRNGPKNHDNSILYGIFCKLNK